MVRQLGSLRLGALRAAQGARGQARSALRLAVWAGLAMALAHPAGAQTAGGASSDRSAVVLVENAGVVLAFAVLVVILLVLTREVMRRRRVESALRVSEERFRELIEHGSDIVWELDGDDRWAYVSPNVAELLGLPPEKILGQLPWGLLGIQNAEETRHVYEESRNGRQPFRMLLTHHVRPDGAHVSFETSGVPILDQEGKFRGFRGVSRDVTAHLRDQEEIRRRSEVQDALLASMPALAFVKDASFVYTSVNQTTADVLGLPVEKIIGHTDFDLYSREVAERIRGVDEALMASPHGRHDFEQEMTLTNGTTRWFSTSKMTVHGADDRPVGIVGVSVDITERRQTETALRASRAMLQLVLDTIPARVFWKNLDLRYQGCNRSMAHDAGLDSPEDLAGLDDFAMPWAAQAKAYQADDRRVIETGEARIGYEEPQTTPDGKTVWLRTSKVPLRDPEGRVVGVLGAYEDITARRQAEEDRVRLQAQVQQTQKIESLGVLAGGIAHDFNNLLMAVLGNADLALREVSPASPARLSLEEIVLASRRAADLCRQMLAYSGKGRFVIQPLDLRQAVEEMQHLLEVSISKKAILKYVFPKTLPKVEADATQIRQVIMNLVINASEAIGERSGIISIAAGVMDCDAAYLAETYLDENLTVGRYAFLEVADTGCGMDRETKARVFDPFFSTKFTGRGLGMAAVLGIVRGHHGAIKVYSEPNRGTTFKVLFPAIEDPSQPGARAAFPGSENGVAPRRMSGTVLVVDDEESVRRVARRMLEAAGLNVLTARDGREALAAFQSHGDRIGLVLLDLTMPHMDGIEAFRELRRARKDLRVVVSSGYNRQEATQQFAGKGLTGFIQKPYKSEDLLECVREALESAPPNAESDDCPAK